MTTSGTLTVDIVRGKQIPMTPLERLIGFRFSEDIYDHLDITDQVMLDLMLEGWQQNDIAELFCVNKSWITKRLQRIRPYLASTELKRILQLRQDMREGQHTRLAEL